jgi:hypothetical protein
LRPIRRRKETKHRKSVTGVVSYNENRSALGASAELWGALRAVRMRRLGYFGESGQLAGSMTQRHPMPRRMIVEGSGTTTASVAR